MVDEDRVLRLLRSIADDTAVLRQEAGASEERRRDPIWLRGVKYTFVTAIEACVDVAQHVCATEGWGPPADNGDAVRLLGGHGLLTTELAISIRKAVGSRNVLVHDYIEVDDSIVVDRLKSLGDLEEPAVTSAGNRYLDVRETGTLEQVSDLYVPRIVDGLLDELLLSFPAISLVGPRAAGKTTTAVRRGGTILRMDRPEVRQSVAASPDAMLAGLRPPVILDEWQEVPELLGAVKRSVDEDPSPGRYILTGSVRAELENQVWPGTGRLLQVPMYGMSVREVRGRASLTPFIDRVIDGGPDTVTAPDDALSVRDYLDLMLAGSFPEPSLRIPAAARRRWFAGYVEQMITRDVPAVAPRRDPELLRRYLSVLAVNTAGIAAESTLWSAAGINAKTAQAYQALFQRMFVLDLVPAWFSNRIKRLVKAPKRYLVDPALVTAVLGLGRDAILYGPDMLGRLLDTFVAAQLRAELAASSNDPRLYHLREEQGRREVDLLIETASGQLIGIEVKAAATVTASDARHLAWLRDQTGDAFTAGIVLHTGPHAFPVSDRIVAAPVSTLWS